MFVTSEYFKYDLPSFHIFLPFNYCMFPTFSWNWKHTFRLWMYLILLASYWSIAYFKAKQPHSSWIFSSQVQLKKKKKQKTRISFSRFDNTSMTQCHSQNHIVLWIHHRLDSDPSLDFSICSTLILDWGMLKRKPQAQNDTTCAKAHDSKCRLNN